MINGQKEIWVKTGNTSKKGITIIAVSNCGRIMRKDGTIEFTKYNQQMNKNGTHIKIYRFIAESFIQKTEEDIMKQRNCIDHITHNPIGMNINDVRNLRWCTKKENANFEEAKQNFSKAHKGFKWSRESLIKRSKSRTNKPHKTSIFGMKYFEHFGYSKLEDPKQYERERHWFRSHGKCRWE